MTNRPYRVGMARASQRYIEPDAIYTDMVRGQPTRIPAQFPYTWTPVNGLGAVTPAGFIEDTFNKIVQAGGDAAKGAAGDVIDSAKDRATTGIQDVIKGTPVEELLLKVEQRAADGVTKVVKKQGVNLILLAVAGGAVGGALSAKLGKTGTVLALGVAGWAAMQILNAAATANDTK